MFDTVINFDFEEVNSAVLRNAQLHVTHKLNHVNKVCVVVPYYFRILFSNADVIAVISPELCNKFGFLNYRTVLDDVGVSTQNARRNRFNRLLGRIIEVIPPGLEGTREALYHSFYRSYRQRKYYVDTGLESYCLRTLRRHNKKFKYLRVGDYFDIATFSVVRFDLSENLHRNFEYLYKMISDGCLYHIKVSNNFPVDSLILRDVGSGLDKKIMQDFVKSHKRKVILRTRNFSRKAIVHNSNKELFRNLAHGLIKQGVRILNLGCPLLELDIHDDLYHEIDHNMDFELELALCQVADACVMTAEGGLFTAFAASAITMVQVDDEWSTRNLKTPISLFQARSRLGLHDIDVRDMVKSSNYQEAAELVTSKLSQSNHAAIVCFKKKKPTIVEL